MFKKFLLLCLFVCISIPTLSHFQIIYTPDLDISGKSTVSFQMFFTEHIANGEKSKNMDMGKDDTNDFQAVEDFFVVHRGNKNHLTSVLSPIKFGRKGNQGSGYKFNFGANDDGDWVFVLIPSPYFEEREGTHIQQITKVITNKGGEETDWKNRIIEAYPEIIPLSNPITWKDNVFKGQVVNGEGKPVSDIKVVIEYLNADIENLQFSNTLKENKKLTMTLYTDINGYFSFTPVHTGYWGIVALNAGGEKFKNNRALSQDAVLWIEAK
ncbi:DUF4198 domain-containing protein [Fusobacterium necrophorum]|uniref:ABC transporter substrate-binding protein n=2 Tax=Fusobacterium necrophorum TaxID=859 RepID=A0AB73BV89_9FUSO|nr:DUF4198 domain-containing protein [Fusobacterium necrophorum]AYZ73303.1 DUF4198 domain-containing protein [Fusobacterium necrophorum]AZW08698.1 DUF4198 domain-containing protein [Fusobacterium necrophorum subsp. necrophorum]KDE62506.1 ABC transporter substrate-binding protein [Fusobacterium necrophorum BL]KDE62735.1 ABC transporter substrate-binding protein [Fusobacterium necrophorum BFTR-1]KDE70996.1 ABC transporter substrate-binding protein [Fusobacterium necrophorum DAB]